METIIEVNSISKSFTAPFSVSGLMGSGFRRPHVTHALDDISFTLTKGSVLGILGPNGAGKTTLLKILSTLILPDKGSVRVNGYRLGTNDDKIKASVGLCSSTERSFYWRLTGRQNLEFFAAMYGLGKTRAAARIDELLKLFGITYADKRFDSYSAGMQQKFALARAMIHDPEILLLDEPTKSLDYKSVIEIIAFIKEVLLIRQGKTVIFTTHHLDEAVDFAGVFMILNNGRNHGYGTIDDLRRDAGDMSASLGDIYVRFTGESSRC